jgi:hypothetical protein
MYVVQGCINSYAECRTILKRWYITYQEKSGNPGLKAVLQMRMNLNWAFSLELLSKTNKQSIRQKSGPANNEILSRRVARHHVTHRNNLF